VIELKSKEQMAKAIKRARRLKPFVRVRGFRWYEVKSSNNDATYTVHFYKNGRQRLGECNCKAGERGLVCYHMAGAAAVHIGIASMRRAA
jgi:ribosomal protein L39E